jgi:hypothetical protein
MRCHDAKRELSAQRGERLAQPAERSCRDEDAHTSSEQRASLAENPSARVCAGISTERIMHAVERQRRITQQLDDLRAQQQQRTAFLRTTGLKLLAWLVCAFVLLLGAFSILSVLQPILLVHLLTLLSSTIALLLAVGVDIQESLPLIPSNNWVLSGTALAVVLMTVMWLRLMRHPREVV